MRLRTLADDMGAILLLECPACLRLALLIFALLLSHVLGLAWALAGMYEREAVRAEVHQELHEMRQKLTSVEDTVEYVKQGHDKLELRVRGNSR